MIIPASGDASDVECPFCEIGAGVMDRDLIAVETDNVVVVPTLKQRPANPGQVVVIPRSHVIGLAGASSALLGELFEVVARVTAAAPIAFGAVGTTTFNNNDAPDQLLAHLHVHVVPRHHEDGFVMPNPNAELVGRSHRVELAARLRQVCTDSR